MWFDTHTHLCDQTFDDIRNQIINDFEKDNITAIIDVGTNFTDSAKAIQNATNNKNIYASVGIHPDYITNLEKDYQDKLKALANSSSKVVAIGEIGLDYHYNVDPKEYQQQRFIEMIEVAKDISKPIIIHDRDAHMDCLKIVQTHCKNMTGVFHCFSGSLEMAKEIFKCGFYISIGGPITFKNEKKLKEMAKDLPLDKILLETDCPCLAPEPFRGKTNLPSYIAHTANVFANCANIDLQTLSNVTTQNAKRLFNIGD